MAPRTRYAHSTKGIALAHTTFGEGAVDMLYVPTWISQFEHYWEEPRIVRFLERLGRFARVTIFDRRGVGMSDGPLASTLEEQMDDVRAVVHATGAERVALFAHLEAGPMAMLFAATYPDHVSALILYCTYARSIQGPGYPYGDTLEQRRERVANHVAHWGEGIIVDGLAPSHAHDPAVRDWFGKLERVAASPGTARRLHELMAEIDVREVLPAIRVPTLVLHRPEAALMDPGHAPYLAEHIPGARLVAVPGKDTLAPFGDTGAVVDEIEEFLTGERRAMDADRVLATVLFTDVVNSTRRASELGDRAWRELLAEHHAVIRRRLRTYGGQEVKTVGDGFLATFDGPARALRAACAIRDGVQELGLDIRAGLHTGELERLEDGDVAGMAVHLASRVLGAAAPGEVLATGTVKDLVVGSGIGFEPRGAHVLRGVPGEWPLWEVPE